MIGSTIVKEQNTYLLKMHSPLNYVVPKVITEIGLYDILVHHHHDELLDNMFS